MRTQEKIREEWTHIISLWAENQQQAGPGGELHPAGWEAVGGLRVVLEVQVNHKPGEGWVRRGTQRRGGGQPSAVSHLTGGVRLTAVRKKQKACCQNCLWKD